MGKIAAAKVLTIAGVNGFCYGGALDLTLACDRRIATPNAVFAHPGAGLGIITGWGGTQRLPRLIGESNALEMFFTAGRIDAARALTIGLVEAIEPDVFNAAFAIALADPLPQMI
jgi:enoyl-CoA hydratase/carnithine racemase